MIEQFERSFEAHLMPTFSRFCEEWEEGLTAEIKVATKVVAAQKELIGDASRKVLYLNGCVQLALSLLSTAVAFALLSVASATTISLSFLAAAVALLFVVVFLGYNIRQDFEIGADLIRTLLNPLTNRKPDAKAN